MSIPIPGDLVFFPEELKQKTAKQKTRKHEGKKNSSRLVQDQVLTYALVGLFRSGPLLCRIDGATDGRPKLLGNVHGPRLQHGVVHEHLGSGGVSDEALANLLEDVLAGGHAQKTRHVLLVGRTCAGNLGKGGDAVKGDGVGNLITVEVLYAEQQVLLRTSVLATLDSGLDSIYPP